MHNHPAEHDAVLGGNNPGEITLDAIASAAVLGGQGKYLALLFDLFNNEAKFRDLGGKTYLQFKFSNLLLQGRFHRQPLDALNVKVKKILPTQKGSVAYWEFAGFLKHKGSLFLPAEASYDPARCKKELRGIAYQALIQKAWELGGVK